MSAQSNRRLAAAALLVFAFIAAPRAATAQRLSFERKQVLPVTMGLAATNRRTPAVLESGPGLVWRGRVAHPSPVTSLRLHVVITAPAGAWRLIVRSEATGTVSDTFDANSPFVKAGDFWTRSVEGSAALIDLEAPGPIPGLSIRIDEYAFYSEPVQKQAIHGLDGRLKIGEASQPLQALAQPVVRLRIMVPDLGEVNCTGFLVTDVLVLTNHHCVTTDAEAKSTLVDFGYHDRDPAETIRSIERVAFDATLDYAVILLERAAPQRWSRVLIDLVTPLTVGQELTVIEHPLGGYKQASLESCEISEAQMSGVSLDLTDFGHKCDTLVGSSGSPVMSRSSGAVVGLHHLGFDLATKVYVNRAVRITLIAAHLKANWSHVPLFP